MLWEGVRGVMAHCEEEGAPTQVVVFAARGQGTLAEILTRVEWQFGIDIDTSSDTVRLSVTRLRWCWTLDGSVHPVATLLMQLVCGALVTAECVWRTTHWPSVWVDTVGIPSSYPAIHLSSRALCLAVPRVVCYVHYPLVSSDMIARVRLRGSVAWRTGKVCYYHLLCVVYALCAWFVDGCMVNSSWTGAHMASLWSTPAVVVHPPCGAVRLAGGARKPLILSQFRPEKDHPLQVVAFAKLVALLSEGECGVEPTLVMAGGVRDASDRARVVRLRELADDLGVAGRVRIAENIPRVELDALFEEALVGLHTMRDEHFGICVVEYMLHGLVCVAHRSGGPLTDIVLDTGLGYLCDSAESYAAAMHECLVRFEADSAWFHDLRRRAAQHATDHFSSPAFRDAFSRVCLED